MEDRQATAPVSTWRERLSCPTANFALARQHEVVRQTALSMRRASQIVLR
jgi:hypothetical protein